MTDQELKEMKTKLKEMSKNDLVRMLLKSVTMINYLRKTCDYLSEENFRLVDECNVSKETN